MSSYWNMFTLKSSHSASVTFFIIPDIHAWIQLYEPAFSPFGILGFKFILVWVSSTTRWFVIFGLPDTHFEFLPSDNSALISHNENWIPTHEKFQRGWDNTNTTSHIVVRWIWNVDFNQIWKREGP